MLASALVISVCQSTSSTLQFETNNTRSRATAVLLIECSKSLRPRPFQYERHACDAKAATLFVVVVVVVQDGKEGRNPRGAGRPQGDGEERWVTHESRIHRSVFYVFLFILLKFIGAAISRDQYSGTPRARTFKENKCTITATRHAPYHATRTHGDARTCTPTDTLTARAYHTSPSALCS